MTAVAAVPYAEDGLFPPCPIAGCTGITETKGQPCTTCQGLFGDYLTHNPGGRAMTNQQIHAHKAETLDAYRTMHTPVPDLPQETRTTIDEMYARLDAKAEPERKQNQTCWCCDERHTCTKTPGGKWECDTCAAEISAGVTR